MAGWATVASGTQTAVIGTEHVLVSGATTNATYAFKTRLNNLAAGDVVELRIYTQTLSSGALEQLWKTVYGPIVPYNIVAMSPFVPSDISIKMTLKQTAGTGRAFDWSVLSQ